MKEKKLGINIIMNMFRVFVNVIFPLITFPYVSRVLEAEMMGRILFSNSIVTYFSLIASYGINAYAIREGAYRRENRKKISGFASEIFTLNIMTTSAALLILGFFLLYNKKISDYREIIIIHSIAVLAIPLSLEWLNNVYEDFSYITKRTISVQIISLILTLFLIREKQDYKVYALIMSGSTCVTSILNYLYTKKYVDLRFKINRNIITHAKTTTIFFVNSITSIIYLNSDTTMLGFFCGDVSVGIYGVASKMYGIIKQLINTVSATIIPRLAFLYQNQEQKFYELVENLIKGIFLITFPVSAGILLLSSEIIELIFGNGYKGADNALAILSLTIPVAALANIFANGILIAIKKEKYVLSATAVSATVNILLNVFLLPLWGANGAAVTTLIAEIIICTITAVKAKEILNKIKSTKTMVQSVIAAGVMYGVISYLKVTVVISSLVSEILLCTVFGIILYFIILLLMKNEMLMWGIGKLYEKLRKGDKDE